MVLQWLLYWIVSGKKRRESAFRYDWLQTKCSTRPKTNDDHRLNILIVINKNLLVDSCWNWCFQELGFWAGKKKVGTRCQTGGAGAILACRCARQVRLLMRFIENWVKKACRLIMFWALLLPRWTIPLLQCQWWDMTLEWPVVLQTTCWH